MNANFPHTAHQIHYVTNFQDLVATPFAGEVNAICWTRQLAGDFSEIVEKAKLTGNMREIEPAELEDFQLSEKGQIARDIILNDLSCLEAHGASPMLNVIRSYYQDDHYPFFPTDVYSFHVDRASVPTDTFLCTYFGASSELLPNSQGKKKVLIPEIRYELKRLYQGDAEGFESFLSEYFFDLHYLAEQDASPVSLGTGHMWRLAVDHPESVVPPCIHRAPREIPGQPRLLLIC
ncbi:hypothetical protein [Flavihumibacter petaseus]|uniref:DUF1826 domain-containing protein n=1 Tax=Flavihumibacter petaseus NBRC 106054 TaxID=1220578 RepID=A0A0E9N6G4_9BACT|nr:hypothetical protein [Flavihumibacter petaseus]GAO45404.1 hypothetical protein FPE01S_05_00990 [Flavihumibacter petaseus NBRC 106054]